MRLACRYSPWEPRTRIRSTARHRQFPRHKTGSALLEQCYARYIQKQEGIGLPSALNKHCDSNSSTELLQRPTAMGHHLHTQAAPDGTSGAQLNTESYTGTKLDVIQRCPSYSRQVRSKERYGTLVLSSTYASNFFLVTIAEPHSEGASLHASDVPVAPIGTCRVQGCDALGSKTSGTPPGTTGPDI
jgi:hypothetical protein